MSGNVTLDTPTCAAGRSFGWSAAPINAVYVCVAVAVQATAPEDGVWAGGAAGLGSRVACALEDGVLAGGKDGLGARMACALQVGV